MNSEVVFASRTGVIPNSLDYLPTTCILWGKVEIERRSSYCMNLTIGILSVVTGVGDALK